MFSQYENNGHYMIGVIVNVIAVCAGSLIGLLFRRGIPQKISDAVMKGIGLCCIYIGLSGALAGKNILICIASMIIGVSLGTLLDLDGKLTALGNAAENFAKRKNAGSANNSSVAQGFITACLLFCIGSMTIVGCLNAGLAGKMDMLYTKSLLDFVSSMMLSVSLGIGVLLSAVFVLVFQGGLVLLASLLQPFLTDAAIAEMTCVGSLMILALGLNLLGITKLKTADFLPALLIAPVLCACFSLLSQYSLFSFL